MSSFKKQTKYISLLRPLASRIIPLSHKTTERPHKQTLQIQRWSKLMCLLNVWWRNYVLYLLPVSVKYICFPKSNLFSYKNTITLQEVMISSKVFSQDFEAETQPSGWYFAILINGMQFFCFLLFFIYLLFFLRETTVGADSKLRSTWETLYHWVGKVSSYHEIAFSRKFV